MAKLKQKNKSKKSMIRKCLHCGKSVDWFEQIKNWCENFGLEWSDEAMLIIFCDECDEYCGTINLFEDKIKSKMIKSKAFKNKVKMPIL